MKAETPTQNAEADNMLTGALKSLFAVSENYPELKANEKLLAVARGADWY
jgi:LemA protein